MSTADKKVIKIEFLYETFALKIFKNRYSNVLMCIDETYYIGDEGIILSFIEDLEKEKIEYRYARVR